ncbi:DedA family protein/thiosulfate sulfurtransferase GlpE [Ralstonia sp. UBA689]|uniref:DedA family protein/thiosulfate sulfurtransferase GlpE n=1 Tax=Ralstonia sp. UBA689 TaxID=1947373 RepID=UPI0025E5018B|nr:DedA family protein/thiosulfate sulfurtransferase GlpE [Ralstonia sp. UBA689]
MHDLFPLLSEYGAFAVFLNVLLTQAGAPLPAVPTLLVGGALTLNGPLLFMELLPAAITGALLGDGLWYLAGKRYGRHVMALLCRVSLSPDSCVRRTRTQFERWGAPLLLISKFIPGLSTVSSALLGTMRTSFSTFVLYNLGGSALWALIWLMLGRVAHNSIDQALRLLDRLGMQAILLIALLAALYVAGRWLQRWRFRKMLEMARISPDELHDLIESGSAPVIIDVRADSSRQLQPQRIPGAMLYDMSSRNNPIEIDGPDREIVIYCACPNEASAVMVARKLMGHGFKRVRPLHGGIDAWLERGYDVEHVVPVSTDTLATAEARA